ncbi:tetratricopeptide repeat protein, partial [Thiorhodococcus minor]|nr:tetratricopeptide repeat protein [Thiorhodococcus minor]
MESLQDFLARARAHHQAGRLADAEDAYRSALAVDPTYPSANHGLGVLQIERGLFESGLGHLRRALEGAPETGDYWQSLAEGLLLAQRAPDALEVIERAIAHGLDTRAAHELRARIVEDRPPPAPAPTDEDADALLSLFNQRHYEEAERLARRWTERAPGDAFGWKMLGAILAQSQRGSEALGVLEKSLGLDPGDAETLNSIGAVLQDLGRLEEAALHYARAAKAAPGFVAALNNLAAVMRSLGRLEESLEYCDIVLTIDPRHLKALNSRGAALREMGRLEEAIEAYRRALDIRPDYADAHSNLGNVLHALGRYEEALDAHRRALMLQPGHPEMLANLGNAYQQLGRFEEAEAAYRQACSIRSEDESLQLQAEQCHQLEVMLGSSQPEMLAILGNTYQYLGQLEVAEAAYRRASSIKNDDPSIYDGLLFTLNYHPDKSAEEIFAAYRDYERRFGAPLRASWRGHGNDRDPDRRLRLGYVSADLRAHSLRSFLEPLLA